MSRCCNALQYSSLCSKNRVNNSTQFCIYSNLVPVIIMFLQPQPCIKITSVNYSVLDNLYTINISFHAIEFIAQNNTKSSCCCNWRLFQVVSLWPPRCCLVAPMDLSVRLLSTVCSTSITLSPGARDPALWPGPPRRALIRATAVLQRSAVVLQWHVPLTSTCTPASHLLIHL